MRISREESTREPRVHASPSGGQGRPWPLILTTGILVVAIAIVWGQAATALPDSIGAVTPRTPAPPIPTLSPEATPTATLPQLGAPLETLYIDIAPDDMAQLEAKRAEALESWILLTSDADFVPATLHLGDATFAADLRLKGDWAEHIAHDKWSFRIELRDDGYIREMRVFSLHDPSARVYLNEDLFLSNLAEEGVLGVRYDFCHVVLNGEYKGIYALEEGFAKELLEFQQRREGVIIRFAEDLLWQAWAEYDDWVIPPGIEAFHLIDDFDSGHVDNSPELSAQRDTAVALLRGFMRGTLPAPEVFDLEAMGKFLALTDLWSAHHALMWHNLRYYYNPVTSRLEPIAFDNAPFSPELDFEQVGLPPESFYNDPHLQAAYARALWEVSQPGYIENLEASAAADYERFRNAMEPEFGAEVLAPPWDLLRRRQELSRQRLSPIQTTYAYRAPSQDLAPASPPDDTLILEVGNLLDLPVEVVGVRVDDEDTQATTRWIDPASKSNTVDPVSDAPDTVVLRALDPDAASLPYVRLSLPITIPVGAEVQLLTRVWGLTQTLTQTVMPSYPLPLTTGARPATPTVEEALRLHPYLALAEEPGWFQIPEGTWNVSGTLTLPSGHGLRLGPGTTLRFGPDDFLLATGPLLFQGTPDAPVVLQPQHQVWRGIAVLDAGATSVWQHVKVEETDAIAVEGWIVTGGVTFYRSPLRISHGHFLGTRAEDALNIFRTSFEIVDTEFAGTASDAFDGDFTEGTFDRCVFHDIGADGIDVSGSDITVQDVRFLRLGDKGLSVGEASRLTAEGVIVDTADFGLASKDGSSLTASRVTVRNVAIAALAAYTKKPAYGSTTMTLNAVDFANTPPEKRMLIQTGSMIDLDGTPIWGTEVDVDALYEKWR